MLRPRASIVLAPLLLFGAIAMSPAVTPPVPVVLLDRSGGCTVRLLAPGALERLAERFDAEALDLERYAVLLAGDAARMRLAPARERVPGFGAWTYDWVQSYLASWQSLGQFALELGQLATGQDAEGEAAQRLGAALARPIRDAFRARVLAPVLPERALQHDLEHAGRLLDRRWAAFVAEHEQELQAAPVVRVRAGRGIDLQALAAPLAPALADMLPDDPIDLLHPEDVGAGFLFLRSVRPMAARIAAVLVRASQATATLLSGGGLGAAVGGAPGALLGRAGGIAFYWGADWAVNRFDSALHRSELEAAALAALGRAEAELAAAAGSRIRNALATRRNALDAAEPCP